MTAVTVCLKGFAIALAKVLIFFKEAQFCQCHVFLSTTLHHSLIELFRSQRWQPGLGIGHSVFLGDFLSIDNHKLYSSAHATSALFQNHFFQLVTGLIAFRCRLLATFELGVVHLIERPFLKASTPRVAQWFVDGSR
jgi:hypothetical protein